MREKYEEKLGQLIDEQNEGSTKEIPLKIIEKQRVELVEALKKCENKRVDLLILEQRFVNRIRNDEVAIKQIEEFNEAERVLFPINRYLYRIYSQNTYLYEMDLKFIDRTVSEWKHRLDEEEMRCRQMECEIHELESKLEKSYQQPENFFRKLQEIKVERKNLRRFVGEMHQEILAKEIAKNKY